MQIVLSPWWSRKSETAGRKKILLVGVCGFVLGFFFLLGVAAEVGRAHLVPPLVLFGLT
jgi:hypothetical protein